MNSTLKAKIIALIVSLLAGALVFYYIQKIEAERPTTIPVVKAVANIPENTMITQDMVASVDTVSTEVLATSTDSMDAVVGKYASTAIYAGEQINVNRLVDQGGSSVSSFAYKLPEGMRTVTINVSPESSVAGLLKVGDHVDVLYKDPNTSDAKYIVNNVEIGALDTTITNSTAEDGTQQSTSWTTVTLFATPNTAKMLNYAGSANLTLTLRNPQDEDVVDSSISHTEDIINYFDDGSGNISSTPAQTEAPESSPEASDNAETPAESEAPND